MKPPASFFNISFFGHQSLSVILTIFSNGVPFTYSPNFCHSNKFVNRTHSTTLHSFSTFILAE
ncbi:MAG: hypothetical protein LBC61_02865 [Candidatus Peribacteria bacterium]|nr:hypothetical protein [Candidatus Peribacteria bacterium]